VSVGDAELLGAPLFCGTVLDKVWSQHCDDLARAVDRLALIGAQAALVLLKGVIQCTQSIVRDALFPIN